MRRDFARAISSDQPLDQSLAPVGFAIYSEELARLLEFIDQQHVQQRSKLNAAGLDVVDGLGLVRGPEMFSVKVARKRAQAFER